MALVMCTQKIGKSSAYDILAQMNAVLPLGWMAFGQEGTMAMKT